MSRRSDADRMRYRISKARREALEGVKPHEVAPGWSVVQDWDTALRETWAERKARVAEGRAATTLPPGRA